MSARPAVKGQLTVIDPELVVHMFAPLDGPRAQDAAQQVAVLWAACRDGLGMTEPIAGLPGPALPPGGAGHAADRVVAVQESPAASRQAVLRRMPDVLNLSAAIAQPAPEGARTHSRGRLVQVRSPARSRMGWADFDRLWAQARVPEPGALIGEARLFIAYLPPGSTGAVEATAALGQSVDPLLPYRADRPSDWWRWGTTTAAGYAVWDTRPTADTGSVRELVVIAAADRDDDLSAWAWSDGTAEVPPFAEYLSHAFKLRYEARLLDSWHNGPPPASDIDSVLAEIGAALPAKAGLAGSSALLRSRLDRLRAEEYRLADLEAKLARLHTTASICQGNLAEAVQRIAGQGAGGMFAADLDLARWLTGQVDDDLSYLKIDLTRLGRLRVLTGEELLQSERADPATLGATVAAGQHEPVLPARQAGTRSQAAGADISRQVFVVHGRDLALASAFFDLLRVVRLEPLEWEKLVAGTGSSAPYLGQVVASAPHLAQATLVLLSPDDIVELHPDLFQDNDQPQERARAGQARPNVLFELGLALMAYPERTVVIETGQLRPVADIAGLNVIRFDGSATAIRKILSRLEQAGCPVDISGTDWLDPARFAGLHAFQRSPSTSRHDQRPVQ